jgi:hypothetical protein
MFQPGPNDQKADNISLTLTIRSRGVAETPGEMTGMDTPLR